MPVPILCPKPDCGASYNVVESNLGKWGRCKKCGAKFRLVPPTRDPPASDTDLDSARKPPEPVLPESFGRYKVVRLLGRGGMGSVYLALDTLLKRQVAVKVPHLSAFADRPEVRVRFFREAEAAARFHHPNFCPIHDIGEADGVPYLTMAFIEGQTLAASIERGKGWPERRAVETVRQLAVALAELHRQGIVHRDLKPANIMIDARGSLIIMDFGLARWYDDVDSTFTPTGAILGTPAYMPPEQAESNRKAIGPRSDLYSLGVVFYELLTGRRPFEGSITKVLGMIAFAEPASPSTHRPDLNPRLEAVCLKAMAKKPEDRHASMDEFAGALSAFLSEKVVLPAAVRPRPAEARAESIFSEVVGREQRSLRGDTRSIESGPESPEGGSPRSRTPIVAVAAIAALLFGIIYVATDKGRIKIEVNDPAAVLHVDGQEVRIEGLGQPITLRTGAHELSVKRGDIEVETRKFVIHRGDNPALRVALEPPPPKGIPSSNPPSTPVEPLGAKHPLVDIPESSETLKSSVEPPPSCLTNPDESLVTNTLGMKLKLIPAGEFDMGSDASDSAAEDDEKVEGRKHRVRINNPFYLGTTEVTLDQFRQFVEKTSYRTDAERDYVGGYGWVEEKLKVDRHPRYNWRSTGFQQAGDHPVVNVSWNDAMAFCDWLSNREDKRYRLPTEAEWEYACRAGQATRYSSGDDAESLTTVGNVADGTAMGKCPDWAWGVKSKDGYVFTAPVGRFRPNGFCLYDMHGNVGEWCADWYAPDYYSKAPMTDPRNSTETSTRVSRGGSWYDPFRFARSADRFNAAPEDRNIVRGFRLARDR